MAQASTKAPTSIFPVLLVNFIGMLGYSIILPFLVFLVRKFGGNEFVYGLLGSVYPAFQLFGAPLLGRWSDQIGRKRVLIISQTGTFIAWVLFIIALFLPIEELFEIDSAMSGSFIVTVPLLLIFVARALDGITGGNVSVANAYLSDISTSETRKGNFGKMASSTSIGFIVGPALASLLGATVYEELIPVAGAALISLIAIFVILRFLPESNPQQVKPHSRFRLGKMFQIEHNECYRLQQRNNPRNLQQILRIPHVPLLYAIYFFIFLGFSFFYAGFPVFAAGDLGWSSKELGLFLTVSSIIMVFVQGPVLSYLSSRVADAQLVIIGSFLVATNFLFLTTGDLLGVYTANVLLSVGNGLMWPSFLSILSRVGDINIQGAIQGYGNSMGSLASIFGLILGGIMYSAIGPQVFYSAAIMLFVITIVGFRLFAIEKDLEAAPVQT